MKKISKYVEILDYSTEKIIMSKAKQISATMVIL